MFLRQIYVNWIQLQGQIIFALVTVTMGGHCKNGSAWTWQAVVMLRSEWAELFELVSILLSKAQWILADGLDAAKKNPHRSEMACQQLRHPKDSLQMGFKTNFRTWNTCWGSWPPLLFQVESSALESSPSYPHTVFYHPIPSATIHWHPVFASCHFLRDDHCIPMFQSQAGAAG